MKIEDAGKKIGGLGVGTTQTRSNKGAEKAESTGKASSDNVTLSAQAKALTSAAGSTGVFDTKKVDEIKAAIADGSYKVDAGAIADKLLANAQEMLQPKGSVGH